MHCQCGSAIANHDSNDRPTPGTPTVDLSRAAAAVQQPEPEQACSLTQSVLPVTVDTYSLIMMLDARATSSYMHVASAAVASHAPTPTLRRHIRFPQRSTSVQMQLVGHESMPHAMRRALCALYLPVRTCWNDELVGSCPPPEHARTLPMQLHTTQTHA